MEELTKPRKIYSQEEFTKKFKWAGLF